MRNSRANSFGVTGGADETIELSVFLDFMSCEGRRFAYSQEY